jgi:hypothetical protein
MKLGEMVELVRTQPEPKWIVPGYIPEGLAILAGNSKIGKSYLCLDIAAAVAAGEPCLNGPVCEMGDVLYIAAEDEPRRIAQRLLDREPDKGLWPMDRMSLVPKPLARPAVTEIKEWIEEVANPRLVILDTMGRCLPEPERTGYQKDVDRLSPIHEFTTRENLAILLVTHTNQTKIEPGDDWMTRVTGTTGIIATADTTMLLDARRGDPDGVLHVTGRDIPDREDTIRRVGAWWQVFDGPKVGALGDRSVQIVEWVSAQPAPVGAQNISTALDIPRATVDVYLGRMVKANHLSKPSRGMYWKPGQFE